ncbi:unnamed protein product [Polarella glacialis]|uniref:Sideroflexin n=1 Tax=Polarella glacialis TaxID=89957 RepID=A0A813F740_POLGL|nr:unnamed protein product [Polarella glacialis]
MRHFASVDRINVPAHWFRAAGGSLAFAAGAAALSFTHGKTGADTGPMLVGIRNSPAFSMEVSKYDEATFIGRIQAIYEVIDTRNLFISEQALRKSQQLLEQHKALGRCPGITDEHLWDARRVVEAILHPVTGEPIPLIARMAAFGPVNVPLSVAMLMAVSPMHVAAAQWLNQTYNAVSNYANRSGATVEWGPLLSSYVLACGSALSIALGAGKLLRLVPALQALGLCVPYLAVASAGSANVALTRMEEWNGKGIPVCTESGEELGMSPAA